MLTQVIVQNFKSFGQQQTVPLERISVLVGPNNSGKSNFLSIAAFVRAAGRQRAPSSIEIRHRPPYANGLVIIEWVSGAGIYKGTVAAEERTSEEFCVRGTWKNARELVPMTTPYFGAISAVRNGPAELATIVDPMLRSRDVKLSLGALRADSLDPGADLGTDGSNLAAVVNRWRSSDPEKSERFEELLRGYVPEIRRVLAPAAKREGSNGTSFRLEFEIDGQRFEASQVSDGVLFFAALVAHVIDAGDGTLLFVEEPENSIHPRRLHDVVELLRGLGDQRNCQFVMATHSPALVDEFRDEPEAILVFRRSPNGTVVRPLSEVPELVEALRKTRPGDMMANGFFSDGV